MPPDSHHPHALYHRLAKGLRWEKNRRLLEAKRFNWQIHARPKQKEPQGDWDIWMILAGRGFGKTRTGAETIRAWVESGRAKRICLLGHTIDDVRKVMVEGESGLLSVFPPEKKPVFYPSQNYLVWPCGAKAYLHSAVAFDKLRGPQFDAAWIDELAKFPQASDVFDQLMLGLRLGKKPRCLITTTPRPLDFLKKLAHQPHVKVTRGHTFDNEMNLSPSYLHMMRTCYEGSALGQQELAGEFCETHAKALWTKALIDASQLQYERPEDAKLCDSKNWVRCVISIDPAVTHGAQSDETGLIVAATDAQGTAVVLDDLSGKFETLAWAEKAVKAYHQFKADKIIAEVNNGGDLVETMIREVDPNVSYQGVYASRGKWTRAEPCAALYKRGKVKHAKAFPELEKQMLAYYPGSKMSPDRLDALVWALFELCLSAPQSLKESPSAPLIWRL